MYYTKKFNNNLIVEVSAVLDDSVIFRDVYNLNLKVERNRVVIQRDSFRELTADEVMDCIDFYIGRVYGLINKSEYESFMKYVWKEL